jgi:prephenate dehydratase/chorismate mutase
MGIRDSRKEIDRIDQQLIDLLNLRAETAIRLGREKHNAGLPVCDPEREREILERIRSLNAGPLDSDALERIFQQVICESKRQEERFTARTKENRTAHPDAVRPFGKARVAFQGERGAFSEEAGIKLLGRDIQCMPRPTFETLFTAVDEGIADCILAPIENSLAGSVHRCYDLLLDSQLQIAAEVILAIAHCLIGPTGTTFKQVMSVESHPVALAQCECFFAAHPRIQRIVSEDTAGSVREVVCRGDPTRAAIGPRHAAEIYGGCILREHLEDHSENYTRFLLLAPSAPPPQGANKLSLVTQLPHRPGALYRALEPFARRSINLLKIESRPVKGHPWRYRFYLDLAASLLQPEVGDALTELRDLAEGVQIFGCYVAAQEVCDD